MTEADRDVKMAGMPYTPRWGAPVNALRDPQHVERALVRLAQRGDRPAREQLIGQLRPLVATVARTYRGCRAVERDELMQEGAVGVLRALERYDTSRDVPFWAYAVWYVRQAMQRLVAELGRPVVLSDRALRQLAQVKSARKRIAQSRRGEPSIGQLAAATGLSRDKIGRLVAVERAPRALDEPLRGTDDRAVTLAELLEDPAAEESFERAEAQMEVQRRHTRFEGLSPRQRGVLGARFGVDGPELTLREIGKQLGISAERVRQIEREALDQLGDAADAGPAAGRAA